MTEQDWKIIHLCERVDNLTEENQRLRKVIRDFRDNWDCDVDAHKYNTPCRRCDAHQALALEESE